MKRLFISGPIRKGNLADNIQKACDIAYAFAKLGYCPFVPHLSCYFDPIDIVQLMSGEVAVVPNAENSLSSDEWIRIDLAWVEVSDVVIRILGDSEGADKEVLHAEQHGIPVYFVKGVQDVERVHQQMQLGFVPIQSWGK